MSIYQNERRRGTRRMNLILSDHNLKFLWAGKKCLSLPMQFRGPSPNGILVNFGLLLLFSSVKRSGSKFSGSGKYVGSKWIPNTAI